MKLRVLYSSSKKKMKDIAEALSVDSEYKADIVPPAYSCDKERLIILGISAKGALPNDLQLFLKGLNPDRCKNVAFYIDGSENDAKNTMKFINNDGINVISDVLYVKTGLLPFSKASDDEISNAKDWYKKILEQLK